MEEASNALKTGIFLVYYMKANFLICLLSFHSIEHVGMRKF